LEQAEHEARKALEYQVAERTAELGRANGELRRETDERERAQQELAASERHYRGLFEDCPISLWQEDLSGVKAYVDTLRRSGITDIRAHLSSHPEEIARFGELVNIIDVNKASLAVFRASDKRELLENAGRILCRGTFPIVELDMECIAEGRESCQGEVAIRALDGEEVQLAFSWSVAPGYEETMARVCFSFIDITERKRAEEERQRLEAQLLQTQKLESLGLLAGGIAHDFNNLLMGILGNASLALKHPRATSRVCESLEAIKRSGERAAELTAQMLAYSGRGHFAVEPTDVCQLVEGMGGLLESRVSKKATIRYDLDPKIPTIAADPAQIRQILVNLAINASEALGDESGTITLSAGMMECDESYLSRSHLVEGQSPGTYAYLEVADTGCGMDRETLDKILDPFFSTKFTGRGLGLAAVLGIVRGHKGAIMVDSEPDRGTTFRVLFPAHNRPAKSRREDPTEAADYRGTGTILVVDDEQCVRDVVKRALEQLGFTVLTATDGQRGVEVFRQHADEIALVILDVTMPHMNGPQALEEIRRIRADTQFLLSSGYDEREVRSRAEANGWAGFIHKPYDLDDLAEKVRTVIQP